MGYITKRIFMDYLSCPTLGWLSKNRKIKKLFGLYGDLLVYEIKRIRETLQSLFKPNVNFLRYNSDTDNSQNTDIFNDSKNDVIINVSLPIGDCIAKADILQRDGEAWKLYEVNIGIKHKTKYINALAFNAMLFEKASIKISEIFTVHINRAYRLGMPAAKMFSFTNCAKKVQEKMPQYIDNIEAALKELSSQEMPPASIKRNCKNCPAFDICIGKDLSQSLIFDMPKLSSIAAQELMDKGIRYINDIPDDFELTPMQKIAKNCVKTNTIYVSDNLKNLLANIKPPYYYLDFESITNVIPIYRNFAPHSQILTQFSIDKCFDIDKVEAHYEYIADPARNCQEVIAQKLIEYFESEGSIITYANFEKIAIKRLAALYPQYKQKLIEITDRIVDFEELIRNNYYDPNFKGRTSIKVVLPSMLDMSYENLKINEGADAAAAFAFMAIGIYNEEQSKEIKENLLKYCAQDTMAMVKIHKFLIDITNKKMNNI